MQFQVQRNHDDLERNQHRKENDIENGLLPLKFQPGKRITRQGIQQSGAYGYNARENNCVFYVGGQRDS